MEMPKLYLDWSNLHLDVLDSLLYYIYTKRVNKSNLPGLFQAAEMFSIADLQNRISAEQQKDLLEISSVYIV